MNVLEIPAKIYLTVGLSVLAHGVSAAPLAKRYARWYEAGHRSLPAAMENVAVPAHRLKGGSPVSWEMTGPSSASRSPEAGDDTYASLT